MFRFAAKRSELWSGEMLGLDLAGARVLLVCLDGEIHAYEDRCLHRGLPLSRGRLKGHALTCPAHEWQYDLAKGCGINPKGIRLRRFPVEVRDDDVLVDVNAPAAESTR